MIEPDAFNDLSALLYARSKDCPGKVWWHAEAMHPAIFRALRMDRKEEGAIYAAAAFRLHRSDDGVRILAAFPCPPLFDDRGDDWLGIDTVLSWNPVGDTAEVMGDPVPQIVGRHDAQDVYASPFAFLRRYAEARARWWTFRGQITGDWRKKPTETDVTDALLCLGTPDKVRWPVGLSQTLILHGLDARAVNAAILRQACLPRAVAAPQEHRKAA